MGKIFSQTPLRFGLLGGGQLGRMLIPYCRNFRIPIWVLDQAEAPCESVCDHFVVGSPADSQAVLAFGEKVDALSFEIENVHAGALKTLRDAGKVVHPAPEIVELIQDKGKQKQFFTKIGVPTAPYHLVENRAALLQHESFLPAVQKQRRGGYDGRGVWTLDEVGTLADAFGGPAVLEKKVAIEKEISVIVARNVRGDLRVYPPVEMVFDTRWNLLDYLLCPAQVDSQIAKEATEIAKTIAEELNIVGLLAVELFLDTEGKLLVNELAPRPHNSGHHTIEANAVSQFEQLLRCIFDLPLGETTLRQTAAITMNLVGEGKAGPAEYEGIEKVLGLSGAYVHLYAKKQTKPGRKMGHVTIVGESVSEVQEKVRKVKSWAKVRTR